MAGAVVVTIADGARRPLAAREGACSLLAYAGVVAGFLVAGRSLA